MADIGGFAWRIGNAEKQLDRLEKIGEDVPVIRRDVEVVMRDIANLRREFTEDMKEQSEQLASFRRVYVATFTGLGLTLAGAVIAIIVTGGTP